MGYLSFPLRFKSKSIKFIQINFTQILFVTLTISAFCWVLTKFIEKQAAKLPATGLNRLSAFCWVLTYVRPFIATTRFGS
jgi:hypothetical protein